MQRAARGRAHTRPAPHHVPNRIPAAHRRTVKAASLEKDLLLFCVYLWHFKKTVVVKSERKDFEGTLYYALEGINEI